MKDHSVKGILLMIMAVCFVMVMNMFSKMVSGEHSPVEVIFWRGVFALPIILGIIGYKRDWSVLKTKRIKAHILRGAAGSMGIGCMFWAYSLMPLTDTVVIMFTSGLITTGVSSVFLKEKVGPYRWGAVIIGFFGALVAATPEAGGEWNIKGTSVALTSAFIGGALISTMLRSLGKTERAMTTVFYFLLISTLITSPFVISIGHMPTTQSILPLIGCGIAGALSLICKTQAYRNAEASLLSPVQYTSIIWGLFFGWVIWDDLPTANVVMGSTIIIGANLVVFWREQIHTKKKAGAQPSRRSLSLPNFSFLKKMMFGQRGIIQG